MVALLPMHLLVIRVRTWDAKDPDSMPFLSLRGFFVFQECTLKTQLGVVRHSLIPPAEIILLCKKEFKIDWVGE